MRGDECFEQCLDRIDFLRRTVRVDQQLVLLPHKDLFLAPPKLARHTEWRPAVRKVGVPKGIGMHELRHYYPSLLNRHGESVKTVPRRLGHATAAEPSIPTLICGPTQTTGRAR